MGWLIALAVLVGIAVLPIGIRGVYRETTAGVWVLIGPLKFRLYPAKPKAKKNKTTTQPKKDGNNNAKKGGSLSDFFPIVRTVLDFLEQLRRKVRVKDLELKVILAGDDPCNLAVNYGRAWAALGSLMPQLERFLLIRKKNIEVECDFLAESTKVYAKVDATLTVARAFSLGVRHGMKIIKDILKLKKLRKGGAEL
ncbi:MAG: DUF2953 domain-containing protein [Oscillospiraceae bacterium]|nr:DUF2953 domain-containing protein [Oscillospiraceae bacterium]